MLIFLLCLTIGLIVCLLAANGLFYQRCGWLGWKKNILSPWYGREDWLGETEKIIRQKWDEMFENDKGGVK